MSLNRLRTWVNEHAAISGLVLAILVVGIVTVSLDSHRRALNMRMLEQRTLLKRTESLAAEYADLRSRVRAYDDKFAAAATFDASAVQKIAEEHGLSGRVRDPKSRSGQVTEQGLVERTVTCSVLGVTREQLARFLLAVENLTRSAITSALVITQSKEGGGLIDAQVTFSAYEPAAARSR